MKIILKIFILSGFANVLTLVLPVSRGINFPSFEFGKHLTPDDFRNARHFPKIEIDYERDEVEIEEDVIPDKYSPPKHQVLDLLKPYEIDESTTEVTESPILETPMSTISDTSDIVTEEPTITDASSSSSSLTSTEMPPIPSNQTVISLEPDNTTEPINWNKKWQGGIIPYILESSFSETERAEIAKAILTLKSLTCIQFVPRVLQEDHVCFVKNTYSKSCSSSVGRQGGRQTITLTPRCLQEGHILHEMMHTVGFDHEQSRLDRDNYITIVVNNISPHGLYNFKKLNHKIGNVAGPYDLSSITHYSKTAFARKSGLITIIAKNPAFADYMGQREGLSQGDRVKVNTYYRCSSFSTSVATPQPFHRAEDPCIDLNEKCSAWASEGECQNTKDYMEIYCRRSCRIC